MGTTPSKKKKVTTSVRTKLRVVSMMVTASNKKAPIVPPPTNPTERQENIRDIVNKLKLERRKDSVDVMRMGNDKERFRIRPRTPSMEEEIRDTDKPIWEAMQIRTDGKCSLCGESILYNGYPCRICDQIFHKECLGNCKDCRASDLALLDNASANIGWSCQVCGNISLLLTSDEIREMIDDFSRYDLNKDCGVSFEEFSAYRRKVFEQDEGHSMTDADVRRMQLQFKLMDADGNNIIDWWEFINKESERFLVKRKKEYLVDLLTEKELVSAKALFKTLDENGDGVVTANEAKLAYLKWYQKFDYPETDNEIRCDENKALERQDLVKNAASRLMDGDTRNEGVLTWQNFLLDQALYIICSRPNANHWL